eukprot:3067475-Pleurochrysis_carterae.AAC.4
MSKQCKLRLAYMQAVTTKTIKSRAVSFSHPGLASRNSTSQTFLRLWLCGVCSWVEIDTTKRMATPCPIGLSIILVTMCKCAREYKCEIKDTFQSVSYTSLMCDCSRWLLRPLSA